MLKREFVVRNTSSLNKRQRRETACVVVAATRRANRKLVESRSGSRGLSRSGNSCWCWGDTNRRRGKGVEFFARGGRKVSVSEETLLETKREKNKNEMRRRVVATRIFTRRICKGKKTLV